MNKAKFHRLVAELPCGKRMPDATYIYHGAIRNKELLDFLERKSLGFKYNVVKFSRNRFRVSLLNYPLFFINAHPELSEALTIDLEDKTIKKTVYRNNPPILHRKELFIPYGSNIHARFALLTTQEEAAGLYKDTKTIGCKRQWEALLKSKNLMICYHQLINLDQKNK